MSYFTQDFIDFFKELGKNNTKTWFDANRKRYEDSVKKPFADFIQLMIDRIREDDPSVDIAPKDAIMRINRDIRFSKDKTPYNTYVAAIISPGGKKDKTVPGNYLQFNAEEIRIYGGAHMIDKEQLHRIRSSIAGDPAGFSALVSASDFKKLFGELRGEQHKRIPPEFQEAAVQQPLIANKHFYFFAKLEAKKLLKGDLPDTLMKYYRAGKPINLFFRKALAR